MLFFKTRTAARTFAIKQAFFKVIDNGTTSANGRRWGVKKVA